MNFHWLNAHNLSCPVPPILLQLPRFTSFASLVPNNLYFSRTELTHRGSGRLACCLCDEQARRLLYEYKRTTHEEFSASIAWLLALSLPFACLSHLCILCRCPLGLELYIRQAGFEHSGQETEFAAMGQGGNQADRRADQKSARPA